MNCQPSTCIEDPKCQWQELPFKCRLQLVFHRSHFKYKSWRVRWKEIEEERCKKLRNQKWEEQKGQSSSLRGRLFLEKWKLASYCVITVPLIAKAEVLYINEGSVPEKPWCWNQETNGHRWWIQHLWHDIVPWLVKTSALRKKHKVGPSQGL